MFPSPRGLPCPRRGARHSSRRYRRSPAPGSRTALAAGLLLFLAVGGVLFARYLRQQIYEERTNQLVEVTSQVQVNLYNALDTQWRYLTTAVNILEEQELDSIPEAVAYINKLERLLETDSHSSRLVRAAAMTLAERTASGPILTSSPAGRSNILISPTALPTRAPTGPLCRSWASPCRAGGRRQLYASGAAQGCADPDQILFQRLLCQPE